MTALPLERPRLLTVAEFAALPEAADGRYELQEGKVVREGGLLRAGEAVLAVEIVSDGSQRTDHVIKHGEYADAGIPHYWIIDIDRPALTACHRAGEFGYADAPPVTGTFTTERPFPVRLDLDRLG